MDNQALSTRVSEPPKKSKLAAVVVVILLLLAVVVGFLWQQGRINKLNEENAELKKTQLPQKKYSSFEDCNDNGGVILNTINGQFSACLGGNEDETGELPQHQAFLQYSAQNLPRLTENETNKTGNKNIILKGTSASADLTQFLENSYSGCEIGSEDESKFQPEYIKVRKEVKNRFALLNYGCSNDEFLDKTFIIAIKLADGWRFISPTNNMDEDGVPSCLLVDMFKVSKELAPKCFENTGYNNGSKKEVTYP